MDIQESARDRRLTLEFSGELDHHGARNALRRMDLALDAALPRTLALDFGGVTFMDSSGIALILRARNRMELLDGAVQLRNVPAQARRVLDAAGLGSLLQQEDGRSARPEPRQITGGTADRTSDRTADRKSDGTSSRTADRKPGRTSDRKPDRKPGKARPHRNQKNQENQNAD